MLDMINMLFRHLLLPIVGQCKSIKVYFVRAHLLSVNGQGGGMQWSCTWIEQTPLQCNYLASPCPVPVGGMLTVYSSPTVNPFTGSNEARHTHEHTFSTRPMRVCVRSCV